MVFDDLLKPIAREALSNIKKSFQNNTDINGNAYADYSPRYETWKKSIEDGKYASNNKMVLKGKLQSSIPIKIFTNENNLKVIVRPDYKKALNRNNKFYGKYHLTGETPGGKVRKWFYTSDELPTLLTDDKLLGKPFKEGMQRINQRLQKELKGKMRIIAGRKFEL